MAVAIQVVAVAALVDYCRVSTDSVCVTDSVDAAADATLVVTQVAEHLFQLVAVVIQVAIADVIHVVAQDS